MKLTKRISLLMAIIMVVTTIMSVMPVTVIAAAPAFTVTGDATGTTLATGEWSKVKDAIKTATEDVTVTLNGNCDTNVQFDIYQDSGKNVTFDGNGYTMTNNQSNTWRTYFTGTLTIKNLTLKSSGVGNIVQMRKEGSCIIDGCTINTATTYGIINALDGGKEYDVTVKNSTIKDANVGGSIHPIVRTGNGNVSGYHANITLQNVTAYTESLVLVQKIASVDVMLDNVTAYCYAEGVKMNAEAGATAVTAKNGVSIATTAAAMISSGASVSGTVTSIDISKSMDVFDNYTWVMAVKSANATTNSTYLINVTDNFTFTAATTFSNTANQSVAITIDGNGYSVNSTVGGNTIITYTSGLFTIQNITMTMNASAGCAFQIRNNTNGGINNFKLYKANIVVTQATYNGINLLNGSSYNVTIIDSNVICRNKPAIQTGNEEAKTVTFDIQNSNIAGSGSGIQISAGSVAQGTIEGSSITAISGSAINALCTTAASMPLYIDDASALVVANEETAKITGDGAATIDDCSVDFATVGSTSYRSWAGVASVLNAAQEDVTVTLNANTGLTAALVIKNESGKKVTLDANNCTILAIATNSIQPHTDFELKNAKIVQNNVRGVLHIVDGCTVDVTNVKIDSYGSDTAKFTIINACTADNASHTSNLIYLNLTNVDVTTHGIDASNGETAAILRFGNGAEEVHAVLVDCNFDTTNDSGRTGIYTNNSKGSIALVNSNIEVKNAWPIATESGSAVTLTTLGSTFYSAKHDDIWSKSYVDANATIDNGAQVRLKDPTGLRFISHISANAIAALESIADNGTVVKFGTVITSQNFLKNYYTGDFSNDIDDVLADKNDIYILDIPATEKGTETTANGKTIRAAVVGLNENQYDVELTAMAYIEIVLNGKTVRVYTDETDKRSVEGVATDALADKSATADDEHKYLVNEGEYGVVGQYSPYTKEQRDILAKYAGLK